VFGSDQHVVYVGIDLHIWDLRWHEGGWTPTDLTASFGGPLAQGSPTAYVCDFQNTQHVDYRGVDGHIHELAGVEGTWAHTDLTVQAGGAPVLAAGDPNGYVLDFQGTQHVDYRGVDGHLYEFLWSLDRWQRHDLTLESRNDVPPAPVGGSSTGYVFESGEMQYVNYLGVNGHIYQLGWQNGAWETTDPTTLAGGPPSISDPTGYLFPLNENSPNVAYNSSDHHIILLSFSQ
jgi:hypothetical protein